jgi:acyl carrier protein
MMIITLEPNQSIEIRFAHGRDEHGDPLVSDGSITVRYDDEKKRIRVEASDPDSSGRKGVVYQENFGADLSEAEVPLSSRDDKLLADIRRIVSDHLGIDQEKIQTGSSILDDLGADSLDEVELVIAFEQEYAIEITNDDAEALETIGDVLGYLRKRL